MSFVWRTCRQVRNVRRPDWISQIRAHLGPEAAMSFTPLMSHQMSNAQQNTNLDDSSLLESNPALEKPIATVKEACVERNGILYKTIKEGLAYVLVPEQSKKPLPAKDKTGGSSQTVFYNPIQQFNRDLSVLVIRTFGELSTREKLLKKAQKNAFQGKKRKREAGEDSQENVGIHQPVNDDQQSGNRLDIPENSSKVYRTRFRILDALSATGLRALRYALEIPFATSITANDLSSSAVEAIKLNIEHNGLQDKIVPNIGNALTHMYASLTPASSADGGNVVSQKYDVIDLDPYGSAAMFLDAAVQAVADGGLLCVTCTDAGVWATHAYPEKAFSLYGGVPLKGVYSHEAGLRLILHAIGTSAARYGLSMEPLLSLSIDFYSRVFVRITRSPAAVKFYSSKTMMVYNCDQGCGSWSTQFLSRTRPMEDHKGVPYYKHGLAQGPQVSEHCQHCGFKTHIAGPMYGGPIHSPAFIREVIKNVEEASTDIYQTKKRVRGMLQTAMEEDLNWATRRLGENSLTAIRQPDEVDETPFFFIPNMVAKILHAQTPTESQVRGAIVGLGYKVTRSHCKPGSLKTDAPWSIIWEIFRQWVKQKAPITAKNVPENSAGASILKRNLDLTLLRKSDASSKIISPGSSSIPSDGPVKEADPESGDTEFVVNFDEALGRREEDKLVRYQINPRANWGPQSRAR